MTDKLYGVDLRRTFVSESGGTTQAIENITISIAAMTAAFHIVRREDGEAMKCELGIGECRITKLRTENWN